MSKAPLHDWEAHAAWVRSVVRGMVQDEHLAEDIAQDALAAGLGADAGAVSNPRAWLAAVVRNQARQRWREQRRRRAREERKGEASRAEAEAAAEVAGREEIHRKVAQEVRELPEHFRTVLLLRYFEEHSVRRIAANLGIPAKTVYSRLAAGRRMLHERLRGRLGGNWAMLVLPLAAPVGWRQSLGSAHVGAHATRALAVAGVLAVAAPLAWWLQDGWSVEEGVPVTEGFAPAGASREVAAILPPVIRRTESVERDRGNGLEVRFEGFDAEVEFHWIHTDDWSSWQVKTGKLSVTRQEAIRAFGHVAHTDEQGRAWLPDRHLIELLAVTDHGVARGTWSPGSGDNPWVLRAEELVELQTHVVDADGAPAAGVRLAAVFREEGFEWVDHLRDLGETDAEGRSRLLVEREQLDSIRVRGPIATRSPTVQAEEESEGVLHLRLPPSGEVAVQLRDARGTPLGAQVPVRLEPAPAGVPMMVPGGSRRRDTDSIGVFTDEHGIARFPWVELGQRLRATAILDANGEFDWVDFDGPKVRSEVARVVLAPARERREFRARILDRAGRPLADRWLEAEMRYRGEDDGSLVRSAVLTDAEGVVHLPADFYDGHPQPRLLDGALRIELSGPYDNPWGSWVQVPALPTPGIHELDDIEVGSLPRALEVQILAPDGSPTGARYWILKRASDAPGDYWIACNSSQVHWNERLLLREDLPEDDYELHLTREDSMTAVVPFRPGGPPLEVQMERAGRVRARLDLGVQGRWDFTARSRPTGAPRGPADQGIGTARHLGDALLRVDIPVATPEPVRPVVAASNTGIPLWTGAPLRVGAGETVDLGAIDLTGKVEELELRIVDPAGAPVRPEFIRLDYDLRSYSWSMPFDWRMEFSTLVPGPVGGEVWADGYRSARFPPQTGVVPVVLQPLPE